MGDDDHGGAALPVNLLEGLRQPGEGPQVNAGLRLVEDHQLAVPGQNRGDLNALDLTAGEGHVHLPIQIIVGAQADAGQVLAALVLGELLVAGGDGQQIPDGESLEPGRLLEAVADAESGPLGDAQMGDVLPVPEDLPLCGGGQAHDDFCQRGFAAAVGAGEYHQPVVIDGERDILQDAQGLVGLLNGIADMLQFQLEQTLKDICDFYKIIKEKNNNQLSLAYQILFELSELNPEGEKRILEEIKILSHSPEYQVPRKLKDWDPYDDI